MPICSVAELFGVTPANTHDVNDTGRVIVTVALLSAARLNVPHCLMSDSNPAPEYYIFYTTGGGATGIGIERFTA